jgi:transposase
MFIREYKTKNKKTNKVYIKHQLVESYRTEAGPRQRIVMNLGKVDLKKSDWRRLAFVLEGRLSGQDSLIDEPEINAAADAAMRNYDFYKIRKRQDTKRHKSLTIDPLKIGAGTCRSLGPELIGLDAWDRLSMDAILKEAGLEKKSRDLAKAAVLARLIAPASEASTIEWIRKRSSVAEIIDTGLLNIKKDPVYEIADVLLYHKEKIERLLREKEKDIFPTGSTLFLYDLTNTYFEGCCKGNSIAKRAKSKEKRNDCPLAALALLVDIRGYPVFSQVYEGNQSEPVTLAGVLDRLEDCSQKSLFSIKPTIVADRGIATKDNIALLTDRGYPYMVVERKKRQADYIEEFKDAEDSFDKTVKADGTIYFKKAVEDGVARLLVLSTAKKQKEEAMDSLKEKRFLEDAGSLKRSVLKGNVTLVPKVGIRIGRLLQRYPTVSKYYDIDTETDKEGKKVLALKVEKKKVKRDDRNVLTGCYVIETTHTHMKAADILKSYHSLSRIEAAFRSLKTDLGIRPVYHQTAKRTMGHLFISVLAYHLLNTIELALRGKGERARWSTIRDELSTHMRTTVMLKGVDGDIHHIRVSSRPEPRHKEIYGLLGIKDPLKSIHLKL